MAVNICGVGKRRCQHPGTNERLVVVMTKDSRRPRQLVFRVPVCNEHLGDVPANTTFDGLIALSDDAVSTD